MIPSGSGIGISSVAGFGALPRAGQLRPFVNRQNESCMVVNGQVIRTNAPALLQYDEWKDIDRTVIEVGTQRLVAAGDLISGGLVHSLGSIGNTISLYERQSDMTPAAVSMSGLTRSEEDTPAYDNVSVPVPVIHKDFRLNLRRLEASRLFGEGLDVTAAAIASRTVSEAIESMVIAGNSIKVDGATIYGYTNHPDRNTVSLAMQWTNASKTGALILADVQAMLAAARADLMFGPFTIYIPAAYEGKLDDDFNPGTSDNRTIRQRIMSLSGIKDIKVVDRMTAHTVVMVQLTRDVVDIAMAQDITTVSWQAMGGLQELFKVMGVMVPRVKSTFDGQSGVVVLS